MIVEIIKITIKRDLRFFVAEILWNDNKIDVTQGNNYPEVIKRIGEVLLLRVEEETSASYSQAKGEGE